MRWPLLLAQQSLHGAGERPMASLRGGFHVVSHSELSAQVRNVFEVLDFDKDGWKICKVRNDHRGPCRNPKSENKHECDISIRGKACGARKHNRLTRDPAVHGEPDRSKQ